MREADLGLRLREITGSAGGSIELLTPVGKAFNTVSIAARNLSLWQAFTRYQLGAVVDSGLDFRHDFSKTHNSKMLGNGEVISTEGNLLSLQADILYYHLYHAAHKRRKELNLGLKYRALSVCGLVYDRSRRSFFFNRRPLDSQENPGKLDAPGGVINPFGEENGNPFVIFTSRVKKKLGIVIENPVCLGLVRIFDPIYSMDVLVMYAEVQNMTPSVSTRDWQDVAFSGIDTCLHLPDFTTPAKVSLLLAGSYISNKNILFPPRPRTD